MVHKSTAKTAKHIVVDARIRRSSTGRYVDRLIEHLQNVDHTHRYTILTQPDDPWQPTAENFTAVHSKYSQFSFNPLDQIGFARQLYKLKADLVHFPMNQQPVLYFKPVVTSTLDLTMLYFTRPGKTPLPIFWLKMAGYRFLFWYSNKKSKAIITISNYVRNDLAKNYRFTRGKTTNTYCASEPPLPVKTQIPSTPVDTPFILFVGAAFPHKNLEGLVKAFEILAASRPDLSLVLVGKKEYYYTKLEELAQTSPYKKRIVFTGFIADAQLKWYYEHTSAYVFPSFSEGFGLPGLEAMVHDVPLISSNATCLPEIYGDAAVYFDPHNTQEMAEQIEAVLSSKVLQEKLIRAGHQQVKKYSWETMAQQTAAVYQKVLG